MNATKLPLERAFELARTGVYSNVTDIVKHLRKEGYDSRQVEGPRLRKQLTDLIREVNPESRPRRRKTGFTSEFRYNENARRSDQTA